MDTIDTNYGGSDLVITESAKMHLRESAKWAKFLAILGFVALGIMVIASLIMLVAGTALSSASPVPMGIPFTMIGIVYLIMAVLMFFPTYYMLNFANKFKSAVNSSSQSDLDSGFEYQKSYYKFVGIFTIIVLSLYVLMLLIGIAGAAAMR